MILLKMLALLALLILQVSPVMAQTIDCERFTDPTYLQDLMRNMDSLDSMNAIEQFRRAADECNKRLQEKLRRSEARRQAERQHSGNQCIQYRAEDGLNGPTIYVHNVCRSTKDVNICLTFRDDKFGGHRNSHRLGSGEKWNFGFFHAEEEAYKYRLRWCNPNKTTASHIVCPASCPQPGW